MDKQEHGALIATTEAPKSHLHESLGGQIYEDIKDGAFGIVLVAMVATVWLTRTWGKTFREAVDRFIGAIENIEEALVELKTTSEKNHEAIDRLSGRIQRIEDRSVSPILPSQTLQTYPRHQSNESPMSRPDLPE
jgi:uncharacterized coiled-coil protein SlyX